MEMLWLCLCIEAPTDNACRVISVPAQWPPVWGHPWGESLSLKTDMERFMRATRCNCLSLKRRQSPSFFHENTYRYIFRVAKSAGFKCLWFEETCTHTFSMQHFVKGFTMIFHKFMIYECLKLGWLNLNIRNDHHIIVFNKPCFDFNFFPCNTRKIPSSFFKK